MISSYPSGNFSSVAFSTFYRGLFCRVTKLTFYPGMAYSYRGSSVLCNCHSVSKNPPCKKQSRVTIFCMGSRIKKCANGFSIAQQTHHIHVGMYKLFGRIKTFVTSFHQRASNVFDDSFVIWLRWQFIVKRFLLIVSKFFFKNLAWDVAHSWVLSGKYKSLVVNQNIMFLEIWKLT